MIRGLRVSFQDDHGNRLRSRVGLQQLDRHPALYARHCRVHENHVRLFADGGFHRNLAVFSFEHDEALVLEFETHEEARVLKVFHQKYFQIFRIAVGHR